MDLSYLFEYVNLLTLGICLCVGFALKTAFARFPNKYIPLAALTIGCIINILISLETGINEIVVLGGMISVWPVRDCMRCCGICWIGMGVYQVCRIENRDCQKKGRMII